jgi:hypothetical protein
MHVYVMTYVNVGETDACKHEAEDKDVQQDRSAWCNITHEFNKIYGKIYVLFKCKQGVHFFKPSN